MLTVHALVDRAAVIARVDADLILGRVRTAEVSRVRFAVAWAARTALPHYSLPMIARSLGGRDHTTILHAVRRAESLRASDSYFRSLTDRLTRSCDPARAWPRRTARKLENRA